MKLVYWFANRYENVANVDKDDVVAQAKIGLVKAANSFDPALGNFGSYASNTIRNHLNHIFYHEGEYRDKTSVDLDAPINYGFSGDDTGDDTKGSSIPDTGIKGADVSAERREAYSILNQAISKLTSQEQLAINGFLAGKGSREIALEVGKSHTYAAALVRQALESLKAVLRDDFDIDDLSDILALENCNSGKTKNSILEAIEVTLKAKKLVEDLLK